MRSQKVVVCETLLRVLSDRGVEYTLNGEIPLKSVLTSEDKKTVRELICEGFETGQISMTEQAKLKYLGKPKELMKYVNGLVNNWIKKNKEFNGGMKYIPENPGSRSGSSDDQIKAMRNLKKTTNDPQVLEEIELAIKDRLAEIKPTETVEVIVDNLPEHLRKFVTE
jgi:hypothetical protein